ncbi:unnamed protein product, partial [marine sediment metagenome]
MGKKQPSEADRKQEALDRAVRQIEQQYGKG